MSDFEIVIEGAAILAMVHVRDAIASAMPRTPEAAMIARLEGRPDALSLLASIHNSLDDEIRKFVAAHPEGFAKARAALASDPAGTG